eukprot:3372294-Amphidinium_carterae.1
MPQRQRPRSRPQHLCQTSPDHGKQYGSCTQFVAGFAHANILPLAPGKNTAFRLTCQHHIFLLTGYSKRCGSLKFMSACRLMVSRRGCKVHLQGSHVQRGQASGSYDAVASATYLEAEPNGVHPSTKTSMLLRLQCCSDVADRSGLA